MRNVFLPPGIVVSVVLMLQLPHHFVLLASALLTAQAKPLSFSGKGEEKQTKGEAKKRNGGEREVGCSEGGM